jgi:hypothetical protein
MATSTKFTFPHETLTPTIGKPSNTTLQLLQRQLFFNARSVHSARGGGNHGHLAMVLIKNADYIARVGVPFLVPMHPGPPPDAVGTAAGVSVALRNYTAAINDVTLYNNLRAALTSQILSADTPTFLRALEDPDFGFGDVAPLAMMTHLRSEYGTLTPEELKKNRYVLSDPLNLDDPLKDLWAKIANIQRIAKIGNVPIPDITIITLTLAMIEKTGLLASSLEEFCLRPLDEWTVPPSNSSSNSETRNVFVASPQAMPGFTAHIPPSDRPRRSPCRCRRRCHSCARSTPSCRRPPRHHGRWQDVLLLYTRPQPSAITLR